MRIIREPGELQRFALETRRSGRRIGLVPTMGFLHRGHASLIDLARQKADEVVVTLFVNPTQFGPNEDLDRYPRDFEGDVKLCREHGATVLFAPEPGSMYAPGASTWVEETGLTGVLCGASRPGHFRGVTTVVAKLFNLALPDVAVFGRKDAQQLLVIKRMVRDLNFPIEIIAAPLIRDEDGLALSSRNRYLSADERSRALCLSQSLRAARAALERYGVGVLPDILAAMRHEIETAGGRVDYIEAVDSDTLQFPAPGTRELLLALAVYFGATRLIDNEFIEVKP